MGETVADRIRDAGTENFPVASRLLTGRKRGAVMAFYRYARAADNVADDADLAAAVKLSELDAFEAGLDGDPDGRPEALALRSALADRPEALAEARRLLGAFRQDARGATYATWDDLRAYCAMSADPVGRFLLALHGEDRRVAALSDPLCTALQVLNHLQDLAEDRARLGRVYLPADWLEEAGARPEDLSEPRLTPELASVVTRTLDTCGTLLDRAAPLPGAIRSRGLRGQAAATLWLARRLCQRLRRGDPLARRVAPSRADVLRAGAVGLTHAARRPR